MSIVYKGKATDRSWSGLPDEVIRLIGTFYLENAALVGYTPQTWETQPDWRHRWMYSFVRDGNSLERTVMMVCQAWHQALQHHPIWYRSISLLDPMDHYQLHQYLAPPKTHGGSARQSQRRKHTPWKHLRNILWVSCFVCRINAPVTSIGLGAANSNRGPGTVVWAPNIGHVPVCKDHEPQEGTFCGLCLREKTRNPTFGGLLGMDSMDPREIAICENEDTETFEGLESTCRSCRLEWLWRKAAHSNDCETIGGVAPVIPPGKGKVRLTGREYLPVPDLWTLNCGTDDKEVRWAMRNFVESGDGTVADVLTLAREKYWMYKNTRLEDFLNQATAARKWAAKESRAAEGATSHRRGPQFAVKGRQQSEAPPQIREIYGEEEEEMDLEELEPHDDAERAQLAADLALAVLLEREEREREEGEYKVEEDAVVDDARRERARSVSPPTERERSLPPHMQLQRQHHEGYQESVDADATGYPASSPQTNTTTTVISLDDANLEQIDPESEDLTHSLSPAVHPSDRYRRSIRSVQNMDESLDEFEEEEEEEEESDEEDDASVKHSEQNAVKDIALGDWARAKILDGFWISPADLWYGYDTVYKGSGMGLNYRRPELDEKVQKVECDAQAVDGSETHADIEGDAKRDKRKDGWTLAVHPCSWTIEPPPEDSKAPTAAATREEDAEEESHPRWETVAARNPPTFALCEQAYHAHQKQLRQVLLPAMRNVVRKLVIECGAATVPEDSAATAAPGRDGRARARTSSVASDCSSTSTSRKRKRARVAGEDSKRRLRDPAMIASRMSIDDVVRVMREEEGVWFDGYDWLQKRRNEEEEEQEEHDAETAAAKRKDGPDSDYLGVPSGESPPKKKRRKTLRDGGHDVVSDFCSVREPRDHGSASSSPTSEGPPDDDGTTSSRSGTSPVLSTTTLQTTPSPEPITTSLGKAVARGEDVDQGEEYESQEEDDEPRIRIPVPGVLDPPKLLHPIPYIPLSVRGFPQYTLTALKQIWREATAPLYLCRCRICERAAAAAAEATNTARRSSNHRYPQQQQQQQQTAPPPPPTPHRDAPEQNQEYRIPSIRLRPVNAAKAELPRRQAEEADDLDEVSSGGERDYEATSDDEAEYANQVADEWSVDDDGYERVVGFDYGRGQGDVNDQYDDDDDGDVVEIDVEDVDLALDTTTTSTIKGLASPTVPSHADGMPVTPTRSARKRSCDETEIEVDHAGRTVDVVGAGVGEIGERDLGRYAVRQPTPPKRQKTSASDATDPRI